MNTLLNVHNLVELKAGYIQSIAQCNYNLFINTFN